MRNWISIKAFACFACVALTPASTHGASTNLNSTGIQSPIINNARDVKIIYNLPSRDNTIPIIPRPGLSPLNGGFCCDKKKNHRCPIPLSLPLGMPCPCGEGEGEGVVCN